MDLRQLNAIVAIAEHGSFSAAADALSTVQSNVSTHVKKLEQELGTQLVERATGELTDAGSLVVARAKRVIRELDAMSSDVTALSHLIVGTVRLGAIGTAARWLVPQLLEVAPQRHPHLHLIFVEATTQGLGDQLANGHVDVGVMALPASGSEVRTIALFEEDFALVVPRGHHLADRALVTLEDLGKERLFLPLPGTAYRDDLDRAAMAAGVELKARAEMDSLRLIASLTFEGCGIAILPANAVPTFLQAELVLVPVEGLPPRLVGVAQRRRGLPGAPVRALVELLTEIVFDTSRIPSGVRPVPPDRGRSPLPPPSPPANAGAG